LSGSTRARWQWRTRTFPGSWPLASIHGSPERRASPWDRRGSSTEADIVEEAEDMLDEAWAQRAVAENDADPDKTTIPFDDYLASHGLTGADLQS
jgi:hypothetical protein